jgi:lysophospholipase L1-like esterase
MLLLTTFACSPERAPQVRAVEGGHEERLSPLAVHVGGRAVRKGHAVVRQWPGTYFETGFEGRAAYFRVGPGDQILHILLDGRSLGTLVKPRPGLYRVDGLEHSAHRLRVEVASESQAAPTVFAGFYASGEVKALPQRSRRRQIEFIGDSHTVGYGNISPKRDCTDEEVWRTTDTSKAFGPLLAKRYDADYQVNAISGRGVVRSYDGATVDTLPTAYLFTYLDREFPYEDPDWHPQLIVVSLGTNDFSTDLHPGETWGSRSALRTDFEQTYVDFIRRLRARNPSAFVILWTTDNGEITAEVRSVVQTLRAGGEKRIAFVEIAGLTFGGCHHHPSIGDDRVIADRLAALIDARRDVWSAEAQAPLGR